MNREIRKHIIFWVTLVLVLIINHPAQGQRAWFADGYHGGIWGHYPPGYTAFIVDQLKKNPDWKINLEIEPVTWDKVQATEPDAYGELKFIYADKKNKRIDFVNPAYGQPYFYNISGESMIRQFSYGIRKVKEHFPDADFSSYSSEEPCFTSALPQVLLSFGFRNASLKNPNTCWGGYTKAYGGELVNWIGPDGSRINTVTRYAVEALVRNSTWQTIAWRNDSDYLQAAFKGNIKNPIGMCLQDAGWKNGPWLGDSIKRKFGTGYTTWTNYFDKIVDKTAPIDWHLSQEDIQVSLVWGAQVLQRIAQQVRAAENKIVQAEKIAALATAFQNYQWPGNLLDSAWKQLLLAQHHDCWIVPYNGRPGATWADRVREWTSSCINISDEVISEAMKSMSGKATTSNGSVRVFNTGSFIRKECIQIDADDNQSSISIQDASGKRLALQKIKREDGKSAYLFIASVPAMGYADYKISPMKAETMKGVKVAKQTDGTYLLETDLYKIVIDPLKGGTIRSLLTKKSGKEWIDKNSDRSFAELRGNFYKKGGFLTSTTQPAIVSILESGPLRARLSIKGTVADNPFTQILTVVMGEPRIDMDLTIDWIGSVGVGNEYKQEQGANPREYRKAFYDDRDKLLASFPLNLAGQRVYKNAPFDVTESKLGNSFFTTWDSIKNNILLHWVDVTDSAGKYGFALFTDHTGNYLHGKNYPLALNIQYAGQGLWGRNYTIDGPTHVRYAFMPHEKKWDQSTVEQERQQWNEPLTSINLSGSTLAKMESLVTVHSIGWEISALLMEGNDMIIRLYNAAGSNSPVRIFFNGNADEAQLEQLDGKFIRPQTALGNGTGGRFITMIAAPRFGIRTIRLKNFKAHQTLTK